MEYNSSNIDLEQFVLLWEPALLLSCKQSNESSIELGVHVKLRYEAPVFNN